MTSESSTSARRPIRVRREWHRGVRALPAQQFIETEYGERVYWLEPWLTTGSICMVHAPRGAAKTWFALSVAHAIATERPLLNWKNHGWGRVLYVDGELPADLLKKRLKMLGGDTRDRLFILSHDMYLKHHRMMLDIGENAGRGQIDFNVEDENIDVIVLDSLSTLVRSGDENDAGAWRAIQQWMLLHRSQDRSIILVHHEGRKGSPRGSSKREDVLDTMIRLRPDPSLSNPNSTVLDLTFTKSRDFFGAAAAPKKLELATIGDTVTWKEIKTESQRDRVLALKEQGMKQKDIAAKEGVSAGRISQLMREPEV